MNLRQRIAQRGAQDQARRQAEQARARERAAREARERQQRAERARQREQQMRRSVERSRKQRVEAIERQRALRENLRRHQREQRQLRERLKTQQQITLGGTTYRKRPRTGVWLKPGQSVERATIAALGGDPTPLLALNKATRSAEKTEPFWTAAIKTMTVIMAAWSGGIAGGPPLAVEAALWADFIVQAMSELQVEVSPEAKKTDPSMRTVSTQQVFVRGSIAKTQMDRLVSEMAEHYAKRVASVEKTIPKSVRNRRAQVGRIAERLWREIDVPECAKKHGIKPGRITVEPLTGATGPRGGLTRYDLGIEGRRHAMIEVKTSGYSGERVAWQLQTHLIGVGEGTATGLKPGDYYRIIAGEPKIYKWSSEDLARHFRGTRGRGGRKPRFRLRVR